MHWDRQRKVSSMVSASIRSSISLQKMILGNQVKIVPMVESSLDSLVRVMASTVLISVVSTSESEQSGKTDERKHTSAADTDAIASSKGINKITIH